MMPPATPVMDARKMTPTMSDLCSMALNAPVTANAMVPNKSRAWIKSGIGNSADILATETAIQSTTSDS